MSAIALSWVATIKVGNQTAKQLLQFYASHNFNKPGFEFKNETLASQLEVKVRAIQNAHKLLIEKGYLKKEERFGKDGSQLTSVYYLNVPNEFVDNFFNKGGEGVLKTSPPCLKDTPRGALGTSLNNNINNKQNKREKIARKKREPLPKPFVFNQKAMDLLCDTSRRVDMPNYQLIAKFENVMKSNGKKSFDWDAEFCNFLINEKIKVQKTSKNESKHNQEIRSTVPEHKPGEHAFTDYAKPETVNKHMDAIKKLLSRKVINGSKPTGKEERQG